MQQAASYLCIIAAMAAAPVGADNLVLGTHDFLLEGGASLEKRPCATDFRCALPLARLQNAGAQKLST